ncbi:hypothetical protein [Sulfuracidifex metallicus]|uniref:Uncharacterized protein n=1 Tax=Sulfuracidifex metallicus DSM 6482 = JCM 9184 TaxID=523847 RepID=A0A6A9QSS4_SULME|nr:hypothetical protein [Sulfuracidifex metallicus]MUN28202.1 hypothetical protein [Sulfuracidifex metallicus DSM 6482 = JCM 9184]WOE51264.1 hypothetical protein RQ359_000534 [Sulfuracidifex metallicus DSM 6482 = JCM 9184]
MELLPRIDDLVDIGNVVSTSLLVPIGIYDMHYMDFFLDTNVIKGRSVLQNWEKGTRKAI